MRERNIVRRGAANRDAKRSVSAAANSRRFLITLSCPLKGKLVARDEQLRHLTRVMTWDFGRVNELIEERGK